MPSPESPSSTHQNTDEASLLLELKLIEAQIEPFLETALAIDEIRHCEDLLEQRDAILDDLENFQ